MATTTTTYPITIQDVAGSGCDGCSVLSLVLFCCSYDVAPGENFKGSAWERICRRQSLLNKLPIKKSLTKNFVCTPRVAPIGRTIIEVRFTCQLQLHLVCNWKNRDCGRKWASTTTTTTTKIT